MIISPFVSQGTPVNIIVGSHVWVEDPTLAWIDGEVVSIKTNEVHVQTSNGKKVPFTFSSHAFCIRSTSSSCYDKFKLCWFFCTWHFLRNIGVILKRKFTDLFQYFVFFWTQDVGWIFLTKWILNFIALNAFSQVTIDRSKVFPKDMEAPPGGVDDMTRLSYLHEPGVLQNLATRYELNEIYVSSLPSLPKTLYQRNCISCS